MTCCTFVELELVVVELDVVAIVGWHVEVGRCWWLLLRWLR